MADYLIWVVILFMRVISLLVIVQVIMSYFMSPYHPARTFVDRLVEPMLRPIRRVIPLLGNLDFSPFVLLILVQLIGQFLVFLLRNL